MGTKRKWNSPYHSSPLITTLYAGLNGLVALWLAINVTRNRAKRDIDFGGVDDEEMQRVIRVHGNNSKAGATPGRLISTSVTWLVIALASVYAIYLFFAGGMSTHM